MGQVVQLGNDLLAWLTMLALDGPARRWEPKALRHRIYLILGRLHQLAAPAPPLLSATSILVNTTTGPAPVERMKI